MPRPRQPGLTREVSRHGKTVWYYRLGKGPRTRIDGIFGSPEFNASYKAAALGEPLDRPARARQSPSRRIGGREQMVYFIVAGNRVKIGHSVDPAKRLLALHAGLSEPAYVAKTMIGGAAKERELHRKFASLHIHGEWFRCEGELAQIAGIREVVL